MSAAAGRDMSWFFDQWLRTPGRPRLVVVPAWDEAAGELRVRVTQTHDEATFPEVYRLGLDVDVQLAGGGGWMRVRLGVTQRDETFSVGLPAAPALVSIDPDRGALARLEVRRTSEEWRHVAVRSRSAAERLDAIAEVGKQARGKDDADREAARALLLEIARRDPQFEIRKAAIDEIQRGPRGWSRAVLLGVLRDDPDVRVRRDVVNAFGEWDGDDAVEDALRVVAAGTDELLRAAALRALAKLGADGAFELLVDALATPGWHGHVRGAALQGFADLGDERAFALLVAHAARDADPWTRDEALSALGRMGAERREYTEAVLRHLRDDRKPVRRAAAQALGALGDPGAVPALMAALAAEPWPGNRKPIRDAIVACRKAAVESGELVTVEAVRAAELRARHAALRDAADDAGRAEARRLKGELDALGVPPLPAPRKDASR